MKLNEKDFFILGHLRKNARISLTELSRKTNYPVSTIHDRIKQIENKFVRKYASIVDFSKLGYDLRMQIFLKIRPEERQEVMTHLIYQNNVNTVVMVSDEFDFLVDCYFTDKLEYNRFLKEIKNKCDLLDYKEIEIIDELKEEAFFLNPQQLASIE